MDATRDPRRRSSSSCRRAASRRARSRTAPRCAPTRSCSTAGTSLQVPHADLGTTTIEGSRFRLSRTPARIPESAPTYGRDTAWVLGDLLGYDEARITELVASGALD